MAEHPIQGIMNVTMDKIHEMKPSDIMKMDWLVDNVVGSIPPMSEFVDNAKMVVELKGVEENKL